jgi:anti-sigma B factor antagonist
MAVEATPRDTNLPGVAMSAHVDARGVNGRAAFVPADFAITTRRAGRLAIVAVEGECDLNRADELRAALESALEADYDGVIVDLSAVEVFDSASLGAMTLAWKTGQRLGRPVCTVISSAAVRRPFDVAGLDRILTVVDSLGEAFALLNGKPS